jgi:hypothetical protein
LLRRASPEPCQRQAMATDRRQRDVRYNASEKGRARHARYNASDQGRARWLAYYNRRQADPTPVNDVTDQHGNVHAMTVGDYFRFSEQVRKAEYARRKRIEEGEAKIKEAELRVEARR